MQCSVTRVVSPTIFWVRRKQDESVTKRIELLISEEVKSGSVRHGPINDSVKYVVVDDEGKFRRGEIVELRDSSCNVLLIDYGQLVDVECSNLYPVPEDAIKEIKPLAFKICLFGVFPTAKVQMPDGETRQKITDTWSKEAKAQITAYIQKYPDVILEDMEKREEATYCSIFIGSEKTGPIPLKVVLQNKYDAFYHPGEFRKRVMGLNGAAVSSNSTSSVSVTNSSAEAPSASSKVEKESKKKDESSSQSSEGCTPESKSRKGEMMKQLLRMQKLAKLKGSGSGDNVSDSGSSSSGMQKPPEIQLSPSKFNHGYFKEDASDKKGSEIVDCESDDLLDSQMPIRPSVECEGKKSIFEDLLKEDREKAKSKPPSSFTFVPAGKLRKNIEKPKHERSQSQRSTNSSNRSGGSGDSGKDRSGYKETMSECTPPRAASLKSPPIKSPRAESLISPPVTSPRAASLRSTPVRRMSSNNTTSLSVSEFSLGNKSGTLEPVKLSSNYLLSDGVIRESIGPVQNYSRPLVLCSDADVVPENRFLDLKILPDIISNLKANNYHDLTGFQKWAIPAISRLSNTVIISGRSGKKISYVVPLIDYVQDKTNFTQVPDGNGPYVVILCSSSKSIHRVHEYCHMTLGNDLKRRKFRSRILVQYAYGGGAEAEKHVDLTNGCHILITTPHCLVRLLEHFVITNLERLCCLVLDDADILTQDPYMPEVMTILKAANTAVKNRSLQKIVCGRKWTPPLAGLVKTMEKNHVLIFGTHLEAAVYAKLKPYLWFTSKEDKAKGLISKLKDKFGNQKIIIVSEDKTEINKLGKILREDLGISPLIADDDTLSTDIKSISAAWKRSKECMVLCIDRVLHELKIDDAETLIHYSLPFKSKTNFGNRFSSLMKNYQQYYANSNGEINSVKSDGRSSIVSNAKFTGGYSISSEGKTSVVPEGKELSVYILVDDENHFQLPHIVELAQRLGAVIVDKVIRKCDEIKIQIELAKGPLPICTRVLEFGNCATQQDCSRRHAFSKTIDAPLHLPTSGIIVFSVLTVHDACRFSARILEHIDVSKNSTKMYDDYLKICMKLARFYNKEENRRPHGLPKLGDICAVYDEDKKIFHRAQVTEYSKVDEHDQPLEVIVRLMDRGDILTKTNRELYEISEELALFRPQAVDIILCGLLPMDFDMNWGAPAIRLSEQLLIQMEINSNEKWMGRIVLSLHNTLCLDPITFCEHLSEVNTLIPKFALKDKLLREGYAVANKDHLQQLYRLCEKADILVPKYELSKPVEINVKPEWAFFHQNFVKCKFLSALNTSMVFLQNAKFIDLLRKLEEECLQEAEKIIRRKDHLKFEIAPGKFCLTHFCYPNEKVSFNRARIENVNGNTVTVFYVDYGDFHDVKREDVIPIPDKLVTQLPFQAIECSLIGMNHDKMPSEELLDKIYDFSGEGEDKIYADVITNESKPSLTNGRKYEINLLSAKGSSLNKRLIEEKFVIPLLSQSDHVQDVEIPVSDDEDEEDKADELDWDAIAAEREKRKEEMKEEESDFKNNSEEMNDKNKSETSSGGDAEVDEYLNKEFTEEEIDQLLEDDHEAHLFFRTLAVEAFGEGHILVEAFDTKSSTISSVSDKSSSDSQKSAKLPPKNHWTKALIQSKRRLQPTNVPQQPPKVILPEGVYTPDVNWIQSHSVVTMKIKLIDVKDYRFEIGPNSLIFCCSLDGKLYALELRLFGTINPDLTEVIVRAHHVEVVLKKLCSENWPRLVLDKTKHPNIHFDVDRVPDVSDGSYIDHLMNQANEKMKKGIQMDKPKIYNKVDPVDWSDSDRDEEDDYQPEDENQDPHDFLADDDS